MPRSRRSSSPCSSTASTANRSQSQALWAAWTDPSDPDHRWLHSATVITTGANDLMSPVHDRMPVLVPRDRWGRVARSRQRRHRRTVEHLLCLQRWSAQDARCLHRGEQRPATTPPTSSTRCEPSALDQSSAIIRAAPIFKVAAFDMRSSICKREFAHLVGRHQVNMGVRYLVARNHQPDLFAAEGALLGPGNAAGIPSNRCVDNSGEASIQ